MSQNDPWQGSALRKADQDEPVNAGHRFAVTTQNTSYYADEVVIDPMTGYPAWRVANDVPHGRIHYFIPGGFRAFGRDQRKKILAMLRSGPKTTAEIREGLNGYPHNYLTDLRRRGIIESRTIWVIK
jgi:hypothetical protein